ncbi:response regulator [Desulfocurvus sp.]|jgi:CheY-like chemotaxis protein|uniref:response regulator n=1 Tax=Desulfocurvus sp. TaxID=2871698 RepID=UPI0025C2B63B|nr:response regulator [Desulfocurvus sp.]MCK9240346.1 response regulator [Desulfocurvus sp.]
MSVISIMSGTFCGKDEVVERLRSATGYTVVDDAAIVDSAQALSGLSRDKIARALTARTSVFNKFNREKERAVAWLRLATAKALQDDGLLLDGFAGLLVPGTVTHALRVCLIADIRHRLDAALAQGVTEKDALRTIRQSDEDCAAWVDAVFHNKDPWSAGLYDILIPMNDVDPAGAAGLVLENLGKEAVRTTDASRQAVEDFALAARVGVHLVGEGHDVAVDARGGTAILTINKNVMLLSRLEEELRAEAGRVPGVAAVEVRVGSGFYQTDIYRKVDFEMPSKVLLVDDEREFVQTLSERLSLRDVGSHVVYDGESALDMVGSDEPEVMILDLKMPGIDGIEVLRRVKRESPGIEVIILTGHGSAQDRDTCMSLGAFAYLQKPVDIEVLSRTLREAHEKIRNRAR